MRTTIELPDAVYQQSAEAAKTLGMPVEQFIVQAVERQVAEIIQPLRNSQRMKLPLIHSKEPGTLDLSDYDFDDLLA